MTDRWVIRVELPGMNMYAFLGKNAMAVWFPFSANLYVSREVAEIARQMFCANYDAEIIKVSFGVPCA